MNEIFAYFKNESLCDFNTFKLNSKADEIYVLYSADWLYSVCKTLTIQHIDYKVIGLGANLVFDDAGFRGAVIVNKSKNIEFDIDSVVAESGTNLTNLIQKCFVHSLGGFHKLIGIPATIGGAIVNNVGTFETEFSDHIIWVKGFYKNNPEKKFCFSRDECKFSYRDSIFKDGRYVITHAKISLEPMKKEVIKQEMQTAIIRKKSTQPLNCPSAGSVFKRIAIDENLVARSAKFLNTIKKTKNMREEKIINSKFEEPTKISNANLEKNIKSICEKTPKKKRGKITNSNRKNDIDENDFPKLDLSKFIVNLDGKNYLVPAKIIDELGLKGLKVGNAEISTKHAGFIINKGYATCADIKKLVSIIKKKVKLETGIDLLEEIEFVP